MTNVQLRIAGMSCGGCVRQVQQILGNLPGVVVKNVEVGTAQVSIDPQTVSEEQLVQALSDGGFEAYREL